MILQRVEFPIFLLTCARAYCNSTALYCAAYDNTHCGYQL